MNPKSRPTLTQQLRKADTQQSSQAEANYQLLLETVLEDRPASVATPILIALRDKDYASLLSQADTLSRAVHTTATDSFVAYQLSALIKKYPFPAPYLKLQARQSAKDKFLAAENRCKRYNLKFRRLNYGRWDSHSDKHKRMSDYISHVIGFSPNLQEIYGECGFGPGASIGVHGQNTNLARKLLSREWSCTPAALPYAISALSYDEHVWELLSPSSDSFVCFDYDTFKQRVLQKVRLVHNNNIVFVPKTTLVDRTIAVEPLLNGYLQKGVDLVMRRRLKRVGIDLTDQTVNQRLARLGSMSCDDPYVTIDLSSASDCISTEMVRRFLPPDWFDLLNSLRSKEFTLDGVNKPYHKFASMGNGFCFPLETLIFASACHAAKPNDFTVYGDDIIVRQSVAKEVILTLRQLGFRQNTDKTFLQGPFRESCGTDWFAGQDIRPLTLDYALDSVENIIKFHNLSKRKPLWDSFFAQARERLFALVPSNVRFTRPYFGSVDTAFERPMDEFMTSPYAKWDRKVFSWSWVEICRRSVGDTDIRSNERYSTALMMGALRGSISECPFASRRKTSRTVRRLSYAGSSCSWTPPIDLAL